MNVTINEEWREKRDKGRVYQENTDHALYVPLSPLKSSFVLQEELTAGIRERENRRHRQDQRKQEAQQIIGGGRVGPGGGGGGAGAGDIEGGAGKSATFHSATVCIVSDGAQAAAATVMANKHPPITEHSSPAGLQAQVVSVPAQQYRDEKARKQQDRNKRQISAGAIIVWIWILAQTHSFCVLVSFGVNTCVYI